MKQHRSQHSAHSKKLDKKNAHWTDVIQSVDKAMMLYSGNAGHFVHWDDPDLAFASIKIVLKDY
ncbi:MAG: hypothetical protein AAGC88_16870 [Bacteroidota bacterium]